MPGGVIGRPRGMFSVARIYHSMSCALPCQPQPRCIRPSRGCQLDGARPRLDCHDRTGWTVAGGQTQDGAPLNAAQLEADWMEEITILERRMRTAAKCPWADHHRNTT